MVPTWAFWVDSGLGLRSSLTRQFIESLCFIRPSFALNGQWKVIVESKFTYFKLCTILSLQVCSQPWRTGGGLRYRKRAGMVRHRWDTWGWLGKVGRDERTQRHGGQEKNSLKWKFWHHNNNRQEHWQEHKKSLSTVSVKQWEPSVSEPDLTCQTTLVFWVWEPSGFD